MRGSGLNNQPVEPARHSLELDALSAAVYQGGVAATLQADPKKQGKEKKPDIHSVSRVFPE